MVCSNCGKTNPLEAKFCNDCGQPLEAHSPLFEEKLDLVMPSTLAKKQPTHKKQEVRDYTSSKTVQPSQKRKKKSILLWLTLFIIGIVLIVGGIWGADFFNYLYSDAYRTGDSLAQIYKILRIALLLGVLVGIVAIFPWLLAGLMGGLTMTYKKLQGTLWWVWVLIFGLIPLLLWLVYLAMMSLLGFWALDWAASANPQKRRCTQCRGWNDFEAVRCRHCGQSI